MFSVIHQSTIWQKKNDLLNNRFKGVLFKSINHFFLKSRCILTFGWWNNFEKRRSSLSCFWINKSHITSCSVTLLSIDPSHSTTRKVAIISFFHVFLKKILRNAKCKISASTLIFICRGILCTMQLFKFDLVLKVGERMSFEG